MTENQYSNIADNVKYIRNKMADAAIRAGRSPDDISLMAVTKTQPPELVNAALEAGVTLLGENRAQELLARHDEYHLGDASIHFIGSLQRNKVRQIVDKVDLIQSVDSLRLAEEIDRQAAKVGRIMDVLIEVNIGEEISKGGIPPGQLSEIAAQMAKFGALRLRGLMTIPPFTDKNGETEEFFCRTHQLFVDIRAQNVDNSSINILSMGMSDDFELAISHGSTLCRIGSALFGAR